MNDYRVLMCDDVNGEVFSFAINIYCKEAFDAVDLARAEFPSADVIKVEQILPLYEYMP